MSKRIECKCCDLAFNDRVSLARHVYHFHKNFDKLERETYIVNLIYGEDVVQKTILAYKNEECCTHDLRKSTDIVKLLELLGIKRTSKQERATKRYKEKFKNSLEEKYGIGVTNPSKIPGNYEKVLRTTLKNSGKTLSQYKDDVYLRLSNGYSEYLNNEAKLEETVKKQKHTLLLRYGVENFGQTPEARKKSKITRKARIGKLTKEEKRSMTERAREAVHARGGFSSKVEKRVQLAASVLGLCFETNKSLLGYNFDIKIGNFLIEVQGDLWHGNPLFYSAEDTIIGGLKVKDVREKDARKKSIAETSGYTVVYLWENEIKSCSTTKNLCDLLHERLRENEFFQ